VGKNGFALLRVERLAHLGRRVFLVVEIADERGDGALEVDVVFPEGIVSVDKQSLAGRKLRHGIMVTNSGRFVRVRTYGATGSM
jgi:hypothetical protein